MKLLISLSARKLPSWWGKDAGGFAEGLTEGEVILDWLKRSKVVKENGKYVFYHGTPKTNHLTELHSGSLLETTPEDAAAFATHNRGLKITSAVVIKLLLDPQDIYVGHWASLREVYKIEPNRTHPLSFYSKQ
jgi:hypothetical protein